MPGFSGRVGSVEDDRDQRWKSTTLEYHRSFRLHKIPTRDLTLSIVQNVDANLTNTTHMINLGCKYWSCVRKCSRNLE